MHEFIVRIAQVDRDLDGKEEPLDKNDPLRGRSLQKVFVFPTVPRAGDHVQFAAEMLPARVTGVTHDLINGKLTVWIEVSSIDYIALHTYLPTEGWKER